MATEQLTVPLAGRCVGKLQLTAVAAVAAALKLLLQLLLFTQLTVSHRISIQQEGKRGGGRLFFTRIEPN